MTNVRELLDEAANRAVAGTIDDALAAYAAALAHSPQLAEAHYNAAALRLKKGDLAGAESSLGETLRLKPDWPQAFLGFGHLYFRQGRFEEAERAFERAAALAPRLPQSGLADLDRYTRSLETAYERAFALKLGSAN